MKRSLFTFLTILFSLNFNSFSQDLINLRNGEQIECKITKIDSSILYYDFLKGERKVSSYIAKNDVKSYQINVKNKSKESSKLNDDIIIIDTTKYIKETQTWNNLITYSQKYGLYAKGWSVQYYGYNLKNTSKWAIPVKLGFEGFQMYTDFFSRFDYQSLSMSYFRAGINPFYKISDYLFLNFGLNAVFGEEKLKDFYGYERSNNFFGISPSQGIFLIPKSRIGVILGINIYEKLLTSEVYNKDIGVNLELGIKF